MLIEIDMLSQVSALLRKVEEQSISPSRELYAGTIDDVRRMASQIEQLYTDALCRSDRLPSSSAGASAIALPVVAEPMRLL
jgi:uncharacterized NAD(P)/FAD-binding protein YdhS